jgi:precorrin isomerase
LVEIVAKTRANIEHASRALFRVAAGSNASLPELHVDSTVNVAVLEKPMAGLPVIESPAIASQDESQRTTRDIDFAKAFDDQRPRSGSAIGGAAPTNVVNLMDALQPE